MQFKFDICDYSCCLKGTIKSHIASVHKEKKPFKCELCDYRCSQNNETKTHIASVHERNNNQNVRFVTTDVHKTVT